MKNRKSYVLIFLVQLFLFLGFLFLGILSISPQVTGDVNKSTKAFVNITNSMPEISDIVISPYPLINLNPGNITTVTCNATVNDYNGYNDVGAKNATLFFSEGGFNTFSAESNSTFYINRSCKPTCTQFGASPTNATCECSFAVLYYATNGTWTCNVTVSDKGGWFPTENPLNFSFYSAAEVNISALIAISAQDSVNFGNLSVTQLSTPKQLNITNAGNRPINVSILGFGGENSTLGLNLSMICGLGNISIEKEKWSFENAPSFSAMNLINSSYSPSNITLSRISNYTNQTNATNTSFWRLSIPSSVGGYCNGTLVFGASESLLP